MKYLKSLMYVANRGISVTSTSRVAHTRQLEKFKKLQASFQCDDGKPIFLKGGFADKILYSTTILLCFVGVFGVLQTIYNHAKPSSWKSAA